MKIEFVESIKKINEEVWNDLIKSSYPFGAKTHTSDSIYQKIVNLPRYSVTCILTSRHPFGAKTHTVDSRVASMGSISRITYTRYMVNLRNPVHFPKQILARCQRKLNHEHFFRVYNRPENVFPRSFHFPFFSFFDFFDTLRAEISDVVALAGQKKFALKSEPEL